MTATTNPTFNDQTEATEVAAAFSDQIEGKTILVTGVNKDGIGFSTCEALASQSPTLIILTGRNPSKLETCISLLTTAYPTVSYRALTVDLSSQTSVRAAASQVLSWPDVPTIDILINSAGVMNLPTRMLSPEGIELTFATNHIGHYLLTCLLLPKLLAATKYQPKGAVRIVNVSSLSPSIGKMRWSDINFDKVNKTLPEEEEPIYDVHRRWGAIDPEEKAYLPLEGYNQSKVANLLFSIGLNHRLYAKHGILSLTLHPGTIQTELGRNMTPETLDAVMAMAQTGMIRFRSLGAGAATSLVAALDPKLGMPGAGSPSGKENYGAFLVDCQISDAALAKATESKEAERLWRMSEELVGEKFAW